MGNDGEAVYEILSRFEAVPRSDGGVLVVQVTDNGRGGADNAHGTGLLGIQRRVAAFDGTTKIVSLPGGPTVVRVEIPTGP